MPMGKNLYMILKREMWLEDKDKCYRTVFCMTSSVLTYTLWGYIIVLLGKVDLSIMDVLYYRKWRRNMEKECCCHKTKERDVVEYKELLNRLNRIEGQIRGIKKMIEDDTYCIDILTQCSAAQSAFSSFSRELLSTHINGCVVRGIKDGDEKVLEELSSVLEKLVK